MSNEVILFLENYGQGLVVLLLAVNVTILSLGMRRIKERLNMLEICVSKFLPENEKEESQK